MNLKTLTHEQLMALPRLTLEAEWTASPEELFAHNYRFARAAATHYCRLRGIWADAEEYANAALAGMWEAALCFDRDIARRANCRFISHANWRILRRLQDVSLAKRPSVSFSRHIMRKVKNAALLPPEEQTRVKLFAESAMSLDTMASDITVDGARDPAGLAEAREISEELAQLLSHLKPRDRDIVESRLGLCGKAKTTLPELGKKYGVSSERIRQIEDEALRALWRVATRAGITSQLASHFVENSSCARPPQHYTLDE